MKVFYIQCLYISGPAGRGAKKSQKTISFLIFYQAVYIKKQIKNWKRTNKIHSLYIYMYYGKISRDQN